MLRKRRYYHSHPVYPALRNCYTSFQTPARRTAASLSGNCVQPCNADVGIIQKRYGLDQPVAVLFYFKHVSGFSGLVFICPAQYSGISGRRVFQVRHSVRVYGRAVDHPDVCHYLYRQPGT